MDAREMMDEEVTFEEGLLSEAVRYFKEMAAKGHHTFSTQAVDEVKALLKALGASNDDAEWILSSAQVEIEGNPKCWGCPCRGDCYLDPDESACTFPHPY